MDLDALAATLVAPCRVVLAPVTAGAFETAWYRIAGLRPRLRLHARMHRQRGRGGLWYVVHDHQTGRHFRISAAAHMLLALMDGTRTMGEITARLARHLGASRPGQGEIVRLLVQLHHSDLLATPLPPDLAELNRRADTHAGRTFWSTVRNPLAIRIPLWDPDRFLNATVSWVRPLCLPLVLLAALLVMLTGGVLAAMHGAAIADNVADRIFAANNVLLIIAIYPVAKALHEAGHAYTVKLWGGEVHEVGVMLLVLFPVPYVDASAAAGFPDAWRRVIVSVAGVLVELFLAAIAAIAWAWLEPGPARSLATDVMLLCGVSTLLFNGNPLLRFDGYYALSDLIGVPNLDTRARRQIVYLLRRYILGMADEQSAVEAPGEAKWLVGFGLLSLAYRMLMVVSIGLIVASKFFVVGAALALVSVAQMLAWPAARAVGMLVSGRELHGRRRRAWLGAGLAAAALAVSLFVIPVPRAFVASGVVWIPGEAMVRADTEGFVAAIAATPGRDVVAGALLFRLEDPIAAARANVLAAEVAVQRSRFDAVNQIDLVQARLIGDQLLRARALHDRAGEQIASLDVVATRAGRFEVPDAATLVGRFVRKGEVLGYVFAGDDTEVHVVVPQADLDLVRLRKDRVELLLAERVDQPLPGRVMRETPSALDRPPAPALAPTGGGPILVDPTSPHQDRPLDRWYSFEIALPAFASQGRAVRIGEHAMARFDLGAEPVAWRLMRWARQLILRTLSL